MSELEPRFTQPDGWETGQFKNADGATIHYGHAKPVDDIPRGTVVITTGFGEFTEKYFETIRYYLEQGYEVYAMDWRGQGRSQRYLDDPAKPYSLGYAHDVADLHQFVNEIVKPGEKNGPLIMNAHSMGGNIGLRYLHDHPGVFDAAIMTAPMIDINTGTIPYSLARMIANGGYYTGNDKRYIPGGIDTHKHAAVIDYDRKSRDPVRRLIQTQWIESDPVLDLGDPTIGWIYQAFQSADVLARPGYLEEIKTPILMAIAMEDSIVSVPAQEAAAKRLPKAQALRLEGCQHEIWMERDEMRGKLTKEVEKFLSPFFLPAHPALKKARKARALGPC